MGLASKMAATGYIQQPTEGFGPKPTHEPLELSQSQYYQQYYPNQPRYGHVRLGGTNPLDQNQHHAETAGFNLKPNLGPSSNPSLLYNIFKETTIENNLEHIYSDGYLQEIARKIASIDPVTTICQRWKIPLEIGLDLSKLALYDIAFLLDDSASMSFEDGLINELKFLLSSVAFASSLFDQDGFSVRFMNSELVGNNIRSEEQAKALVEQAEYHGLTPLASSLRYKILDPLLYGPARKGTLNKPILVIIITDGRPTDKPDTLFKDTVKQAKEFFQGRGMVAFQIAQVGTDLGAQEFLGNLDKDPSVGGLIDCTSNFELESMEFASNPQSRGNQLTRELWYTKLLLGSIDKTYDKKDEGKSILLCGYPALGIAQPSQYGVPSQGFQSQPHLQQSQHGIPPYKQHSKTEQPSYSYYYTASSPLHSSQSLLHPYPQTTHQDYGHLGNSASPHSLTTQSPYGSNLPHPQSHLGPPSQQYAEQSTVSLGSGCQPCSQKPNHNHQPSSSGRVYNPGPAPPAEYNPNLAYGPCS